MKTFIRWLFPKTSQVKIGTSWDFDTSLYDDPFMEQAPFFYKVLEIKKGYAKVAVCDKETGKIAHTSSKTLRELCAFYKQIETEEA